jgi:hypothetical protein
MKINVSFSFFGSCYFSEFGGQMALKFLRVDLLKDIEIVPLGDPTATHFVAFDHSSGTLNAFGNRLDRTKRMLLVIEPKAVNPSQYRKKIRNEYAVCIVGSRRHHITDHELFINHAYLPAAMTLVSEMSSPRIGRIGIGILNENKYSFVRGNQYKIRVKAIGELAKAHHLVTVGGKNWNRSKAWQFLRQLEHAYACIKMGGDFEIGNFHWSPRSKYVDYVGRVDSEVGFLSKFEFALVIENDPDYVSEKLFNAIRAQAIPIFIGPPLAEFGLPPEIAIEVSGGKGSVLKAIKHSTLVERFTVIKAGQDFLRNQVETGFWLEETTSVAFTESIMNFLSRS